MAKTAIHEQAQALSVYFRDMLAEPEKTPTLVENTVETDIAEAAVPNSPADNQSTLDTNADVVTPAVAAKENFLLCQIGGMPLAIAVSSLTNIVHWPKQGLSQLPGQADWQLGLLHNRERQCDVVDIRVLLQTPDTTTKTSADYILLLDQGRRGIACNMIEQIRSINADAINWCQDRRQRPWFLGVLSESMHSIVDIEALLATLSDGEMA